LIFPAFWFLHLFYKNLKKDNVDGRGRVLLTEDCHHSGPWDGDYECRGTYQQGSGMVTVSDAAIRVTGQYFRGEYVGDIYRDQSVSADAPARQQHYKSGEERRSLLHNLPPLAVVMGSLMLMIWSLLPRRRAV
jgi:hypothetical protein